MVVNQQHEAMTEEALRNKADGWARGKDGKQFEKDTSYVQYSKIIG